MKLLLNRSLSKSVKIIIFCFFFINSSSYCQIIPTSACINSDFSLNNFNNWTGCSGYFEMPCATQGFTLNRQTIITTPGTDPYSCGGLQIIPQGVNQVVRLGNSGTGAQAERMIYQIAVDTNISGLFVYNFALVLQIPMNGGHSFYQMPKFEIRILDQAGIPLSDTCSHFLYYVGCPGFNPNTCILNSDFAIDWFDWQTIGVSLKPFHGQNVSIEFTTYDCSLGAHFGYAYLYAYCIPRKINMFFCNSHAAATLVAPKGFYYKWLPGGDTTQSISIQNPVTNSVYSCVLTSKSNSYCVDTLSTTILPDFISADFNLSNTCMNQPATFTIGTAKNHWFWDFGDTASLTNHTDMGSTVNHTYTAAGNYTVTLIDTLFAGCGDTVQKNIIVYPTPTLSVNNPTLCPGQSATISVHGADSYIWDDNYTDSIRIITPNQTTSYTIYGYNDSIACMDSIKSTITVLPELNTGLTAEISKGCEPLVVKFSCSPNIAVNSYLWEFGDGDTSLSATPVHIFNAGSYQVKLTLFLGNICQKTFYFPVLIESLPRITAEFTWTPLISAINNPVQFTNLSQPTGFGENYKWFFNDNTLPEYVMNPMHSFANFGFYPIEMISDNGYCSDTVYHTITVIDENLIFPNIITPNGDGSNDFLEIKGLNDFSFPENHLYIYNRWGKLVYEKLNYHNEFDGGGLADGVYYYIFNAKGLLHNFDYKSSLEILRK